MVYSIVSIETEINCSIYLNLKCIGTSWPLVIQEPKNATVMEGEKVELECRALNDPDATTQWIKRNSDSGSTSGAAPNENVITS